MADVTPEAARWRSTKGTSRWTATEAAGDALADLADRQQARITELTDALRELVVRANLSQSTSTHINHRGGLLQALGAARRVLGETD